MAAIDKIYGTKAQHDEFRTWCAANKPEALRFFYDWSGWDDGGVHPITNFPETMDSWLWVNCPIEFVRQELKEQYGVWIDVLEADMLDLTTGRGCGTISGEQTPVAGP